MKEIAPVRGPVLIAGGPAPLVEALAERYLTTTDADVIVVGPASGLDRLRVRHPRSSGRLRVIARSESGAAGTVLLDRVRAEVVWSLAASTDHPALDDTALTRSLLAALDSLGARQFCYAYPPGPADVDVGPPDRRPGLESEVVERCRALGVNAHLVRLDPLADGEPGASPRTHDGDLTHLLRSLAAVVATVDERSPGYLRRQPLRLMVSHDAVTIPTGVEALALIPQSVPDAPTTSPVKVIPAAALAVPDVLRHAATALDIRIGLAAGDADLSPVDRLLARRLGTLGPALRRSGVAGGGNRPTTADAYALDGPRLRTLAASIRDEHAATLRGHSAPPLSTTVIADVAGAPLTYVSGGSSGRPIILINALGQSTVLLHRLIGNLLPRRVLTWQPRGVEEPLPADATISEHASDLEAILNREGVSSCDLVGWCTGPRVAMELFERRPGLVASMVFLNPSFKCVGDDDGLDTGYERNLEYICLTLRRDPSLAGRLTRLFGQDAATPLDPDADADTQAADVLRAVSQPLRAQTRRPFAQASTLVRYAGQLTDFWSRNAVAAPWRAPIPTLCVSAEYDDVASPERARRAVRAMSNATHVDLCAAGHYVLHDEADTVARLITDFVSNPAATARGL